MINPPSFKTIQFLEVKREIYVKFKEEDGSVYFNRILFATLDEEGNITLMDEDKDGVFDDPVSCINFVGYHYGPKK